MVGASTRPFLEALGVLDGIKVLRMDVDFFTAFLYPKNKLDTFLGHKYSTFYQGS